ncbi:hypothetical protein, partial [Acrocarpospora catenulata]|uniref:hypothetical protein n=1 Tax=Acrocarpospora catenulata TaxID=2836182 RepID=UPI001BDA1AAD
MTRGQPARPRVPNQPWRARTTDLITGLYGHGAPLLFQITGGPGGTRVWLGTCAPPPGSPPAAVGPADDD